MTLAFDFTSLTDDQPLCVYIMMVWVGSTEKWIADIARTRGHPAVPWCTAYTTTTILGATAGYFATRFLCRHFELEDFLESLSDLGCIGMGVAFSLCFARVQERKTTLATPRQTSPSTPLPAQPVTVAFKFPCVHCGQRISTTADDIGTVGECPSCQHSITVPSPSRENAGESPRVTRAGPGSS